MGIQVKLKVWLAQYFASFGDPIGQTTDEGKHKKAAMLLQPALPDSSGLCKGLLEPEVVSA